jgi:endonuclease/exonuclease/phosphatase family metal-dependent hydrolase
MKIVTFNIRCDYNQDGINSFQYRKPYIIEKIKKEQPDIICFQEVLPHVSKWMKETFADYYFIGVGRNENYQDEQATIAYKKDNISLIEFRTLWLSKTPEVPGSRYENQSYCPRTCAYAIFRIEEEGTLFRVYNTHLDHEGSKARMLGLDQINKVIQEETQRANLPVILLGDFNAEPDSQEINEFVSHTDLKDITSSLPVTFHNYGQEKDYEKIDYIYISPNISCNQVEAWTDCMDKVFLSDHYPICAQLTIH